MNRTHAANSGYLRAKVANDKGADIVAIKIWNRAFRKVFYLAANLAGQADTKQDSVAAVGKSFHGAAKMVSGALNRPPKA